MPVGIPLIQEGHKQSAIDGALVVSGIGGALMSHLMDITQIAQQLTIIFGCLMAFFGCCLAALRFIRALRKGE